MRAQFLGTAAAEGYPDAFCGCANCRRAREAGGPSLRKRSALLIDDDLLIDLGPDVLTAAHLHAAPLDRLRFCLQTHEHADHLHPALLLARSPFCGVHDAPQLQYYATRGALDTAITGLGRHRASFDDTGVSEGLNLAVHVIEPFQSFIVGPYRVTTLRAAHDPQAIVALLFLIERNGRSLFYATDTGPLPEATWTALGAWGGSLDAVIMDHTFGLGQPSTGHLNAAQFLAQIARLRAAGLLAKDARIYAHHIAHHSNPIHPELMAIAATSGYLVAHDGLSITI